MSFFSKHKLGIATSVYWLMLLYIIAALTWWFISLNHQNEIVTSLRLSEIKKGDASYIYQSQKVIEIQKRKTAQYIGEGATFLAILLIGAVFIYRSVRKEIFFSQQQQNFMMAVTHELKTPIAIATLNLETLQRRQLDEEQRQMIIAGTLDEAYRLNALCNNILLASQLESIKPTRLLKEDIDFSETVIKCIENFARRYSTKYFEYDIAPGIMLKGELFLIELLVNNLIENAVKYSSAETNIMVQLHRLNDIIQLKITDEGIGVPNEEKKKIFDKFYRSGNENIRSTKGTGLGLYICKKIVLSHHGHIYVTDNHPKGSVFIVNFNYDNIA